VDRVDYSSDAFTDSVDGWWDDWWVGGWMDRMDYPRLVGGMDGWMNIGLIGGWKDGSKGLPTIHWPSTHDV
jgi:hypothetical protein